MKYPADIHGSVHFICGLQTVNISSFYIKMAVLLLPLELQQLIEILNNKNASEKTLPTLNSIVELHEENERLKSQVQKLKKAIQSANRPRYQCDGDDDDVIFVNDC